MNTFELNGKTYVVVVGSTKHYRYASLSINLLSNIDAAKILAAQHSLNFGFFDRLWKPLVYSKYYDLMDYEEIGEIELTKVKTSSAVQIAELAKKKYLAELMKQGKDIELQNVIERINQGVQE